MDYEETKSWIYNFYEARSRNDPEACLANFSEGATIRLGASKKLGSLGDVHTGKAALESVVAALCSTWDFSNMKPNLVLIEGNRAAARNAGIILHSITGKSEPMELVDLFEFEGRKCISFVEYFDTWAATNLFTNN